MAAARVSAPTDRSESMLSEVAEKLTTPSPPSVLYHYTTLPSALEILKSKTLWATQADYLNDTSERQLAYSLANEALQSSSALRSLGYDDEREKLFWQVNIRMSTFAYIVSFSAASDDLGLWRGYASQSVGVAIGFDTAQLQAASERENAYLVRCRYEPDEHRELVGHAVALIVRAIEERLAGGQPADAAFQPAYSEVMRVLSFISPAIKHNAFRAESEWRIVAPLREAAGGLQVRVAAGRMMPFIAFPMVSKDEQLYVPHIVVGPSVDPGRLENFLALACYSTDVRFDKIDRTAIPFRG